MFGTAFEDDLVYYNTTLRRLQGLSAAWSEHSKTVPFSYVLSALRLAFGGFKSTFFQIILTFLFYYHEERTSR